MSNQAGLKLVERAELRAQPAIKFSTLLQLSEQEVARLVSFLESDQLFKRLYWGENRDWKVFSRQRFPSSRLNSSFYNLDDLTHVSETSSPEIETVLVQHKNLLKQIEKIGQEKFEFYFLYDEGEKTSSEIALELSIAEETVLEIREMTNQVLIKGQFEASPGGDFAQHLSYSRIAAYAVGAGGGLEIEFFSPAMARGLYKINYDRLNNLKKSGAFSQQEKKTVQEMVKWLELLNGRKNLIFRILRILPNRQKKFLLEGDWDLLVPLTQKDVALELNVTPGAVCRALGKRSIVTPAGEEVPIIDLFPSKKDILRRKITPLIGGNPGLTDRQLRGLVHKNFAILLSRRSINVYRREIGGIKAKKS